MLVGVALAMLAVVGSLSAPASAADVPRLGYVGRVAGTKAFVGVVVRGNRVMAYVCDGRKLARWFEGTLRGERARLRSRSGGRLTLKVVSARRARGVLRLPGRKRLRFAAAAARGRAGLFRDERDVTRSGRPRRALTGWVRLNNGRVRGATATSRYRIEHPSRGITVVLDAATGGTISSPSSGPERAQRVTGTAVPICRWFIGATSKHPPAADDAGLWDPARRDRAEPPDRTERALAAERLPALAGGARALRRQDRRPGRPPAQGGVAKGRPVRPGSHLRVRAREDRHPRGRDAQRQPPVECGRVAAPRHPARGDRADGGLCEPGSTAARQGPRPDAERRPARRGRGHRHRPARSRYRSVGPSSVPGPRSATSSPRATTGSSTTTPTRSAAGSSLAVPSS